MKAVDIAAEMRAHVARHYITQAKAAEVWGVSTSMVSKVLAGTIQPTKTMLDDAGFEAIKTDVKYVHKQKKEKSQ